MILDDIVAATRIRLKDAENAVPLNEIKRQALKLNADTGFLFKEALSKKELSFICEVKKASPSKGVIAEDFPYLEIAKSYLDAGADAISVLTEPKFFMGAPEYLSEIAAAVPLPCLRKDFIISEYQIYRAKVLGASAVLLICAILDDESLIKYLELAHSLGMSALVETHSEDEVLRALNAGAEIIGINNRDLTTFNVSLDTTKRLIGLIPDDRIKVSESGIHTPDDIAYVREAGADAVLIGEAFMRSDDKSRLLKGFKETL